MSVRDGNEHSHPESRKRRLVLLGAGHAHLEVIRFTHSFTRRGHSLTVVAPGPFWYSGLATGMLGGTYHAEEDQVDVARMVRGGGGCFCCALVTAVDPGNRLIQLREGPPLSYDFLSLNLGSEVPTWQVEGLTEHSIAVKPISNLLRLREEVSSRLTTGQGLAPLQIVVIGGGATACEIAGNLHGLTGRLERKATITLVAGDDRLMCSWSERSSQAVFESLRGRGINMLLGSPATRVEPGLVFTDQGRYVPFDFLVAATGLVPPRLIRTTGLPTDRHGGLLVDEHLRSVADPTIFGGGDCIALEGHDLPRVGVHAVRQAPILRHNLLAVLEGRPSWAFREFRPQGEVLQILNLGDGTGLAARGDWLWHGKLALQLKELIDRRFLAAYR
jgi:NADH dehydrogenase FAD-containing subunit